MIDSASRWLSWRSPDIRSRRLRSQRSGESVRTLAVEVNPHDSSMLSPSRSATMPGTGRSGNGSVTPTRVVFNSEEQMKQALAVEHRRNSRVLMGEALLPLGSHPVMVSPCPSPSFDKPLPASPPHTSAGPIELPGSILQANEGFPNAGEYSISHWGKGPEKLPPQVLFELGLYRPPTAFRVDDAASTDTPASTPDSDVHDAADARAHFDEIASYRRYSESPAIEPLTPQESFAASFRISTFDPDYGLENPNPYRQGSLSSRTTQESSETGASGTTGTDAESNTGTADTNTPPPTETQDEMRKIWRRLSMPLAPEKKSITAVSEVVGSTSRTPTSHESPTDNAIPQPRSLESVPETSTARSTSRKSVAENRVLRPNSHIPIVQPPIARPGSQASIENDKLQHRMSVRQKADAGTGVYTTEMLEQEMQNHDEMDSLGAVERHKLELGLAHQQTLDNLRNGYQSKLASLKVLTEYFDYVIKFPGTQVYPEIERVRAAIQLLPQIDSEVRRRSSIEAGSTRHRKNSSVPSIVVLEPSPAPTRPTSVRRSSLSESGEDLKVELSKEKQLTAQLKAELTKSKDLEVRTKETVEKQHKIISDLEVQTFSLNRSDTSPTTDEEAEHRPLSRVGSTSSEDNATHLKQQIRDLNGTVAARDDEISDLKTRLASEKQAVQSTFAEYQSKLMQLKNAEAAHEADILSVETANQKLRRELYAAESHYEGYLKMQNDLSAVQALNEKHQAEVSSVRERLADREAELAALRAIVSTPRGGDRWSGRNSSLSPGNISGPSSAFASPSLEVPMTPCSAPESPDPKEVPLPMSPASPSSGSTTLSGPSPRLRSKFSGGLQGILETMEPLATSPSISRRQSGVSNVPYSQGSNASSTSLEASEAKRVKELEDAVLVYLKEIKLYKLDCRGYKKDIAGFMAKEKKTKEQITELEKEITGLKVQEEGYEARIVDFKKRLDANADEYTKELEGRLDKALAENENLLKQVLTLKHENEQLVLDKPLLEQSLHDREKQLATSLSKKELLYQRLHRRDRKIRELEELLHRLEEVNARLRRGGAEETEESVVAAAERSQHPVGLGIQELDA